MKFLESDLLFKAVNGDETLLLPSVEPRLLEDVREKVLTTLSLYQIVTSLVTIYHIKESVRPAFVNFVHL